MERPIESTRMATINNLHAHDADSNGFFWNVVSYDAAADDA